MSRFILSAFADEIDPGLDVQMDVLEQHGISYIEMRGVGGKNITQYSLEEVMEIKRRLDKRGFRISAIGSPIGKISITDDFGPHLELFRHTLEIAKILETRYIRMFSFYIPEGEKPENYRGEVMDRWRRFLEAAEGTGIMLLHENEKDIYGDTPQRCLDLVKEMDNGNMKLIFDPANFVQCDVETYPEAYELLKEHVVYLHIKDAVYSDHHVVPAGQGDGKVKEILESLYKRGFEGFLSIEPHLWNFVGFAELENRKVEASEEDSGPDKFAIAAYALKKLIREVTGEAR
ncbi:MAG TPA: sugar phosphate isomerase/epimerase family protein [Clostridia bacterium]